MFQIMSLPALSQCHLFLSASNCDALRTDKDCNEAPRSPLSDAGSSSSDSESSGPDTPTELKHDLPFSAGSGYSFKGPPDPIFQSIQWNEMCPLKTTWNIDDFVIVGHQAPDPPTPTIDYPSTEWTPSTLPGSFGKATAPSDIVNRIKSRLTQ
ncbi:hypothetical protein RHS01_07941 [Rhizoctonia solani]|uniref:Uncharacterized protein n=1 Tax=Rhizoctonia solani TaxID=456999 RepID=A0A8H7M2B3_9AGAM|nr:hypothetical protein RHS01_07941 [Rhizoctonia solani]